VKIIWISIGIIILVCLYQTKQWYCYTASQCVPCEWGGRDEKDIIIEYYPNSLDIKHIEIPKDKGFQYISRSGLASECARCVSATTEVEKYVCQNNVKYTLNKGVNEEQNSEHKNSGPNDAQD